MIVPRNRLLFWVAAVVLPFALLAGVEPAAAPVALGILAAFGLLVIGDAFGARRGVRELKAELPPIVRLSKDRPGRVDLRLGNPSQRSQVVRIAIATPVVVESAVEDLTVALPAGSEWSHLVWDCTARQRGRFPLESVHVEGLSPLGFWAGRRRLPVRCELRAYPNLLSERRQLAALFLNRGGFGVHAQRQVGKGRDFEKLREYVPGDGFDEIHWKATARRGRPITKVYQLERTQEVYVVIDASRLSARKPPPLPAEVADLAAAGRPDSGPVPTTLERYLTAALVMGLAAEQQGDLFGLVTFSDRIERFVRARNGKAHYGACRDALYLLEPRIVSPDFEELFTFLRLRLRRRALLVVLTALDDPVLAEGFVRHLDLVSRQHLVMVNMMQPPGAEPVFSHPNVASLDELYQRLGGHLQWHKLRELETVLKRRGVQFAQLANERLCADLVAQYLNVKRRQLL
jgi:uncharacterized protein (DUF58 family)